MAPRSGRAKSVGMRLLKALALPAFALAAASACGGPATPVREASPSGNTKRPPVVLAIVVDQLSSWIAASRLPALPKDGGFARLTREGTYVTSLRYPYAVTDTAPGHAALNTGEVPARSGIFANEIPDARGERVSILRDEGTKLVGEAGPVDRVGSSAASLQADTVADRLRKANKDAFIVSVSLKDRGAILPGGRGTSHTLWYDAKVGSFVTSTAFADALPRWAVEVGGKRAVEERRKAPWVPLDAAWLAANAATPDDAPGEGDYEGLGRTFPHVARNAASFRAIPASDEALAALAVGAIEAGYRPDAPALVLVSFSAHDIIGHIFGPDSWEAWDYVRRLDRRILELWNAIEAKVGGPIDIVLSADHGDVAMPEAAALAAKARGASCDSFGDDPSDALARPCKGGVRLEADPLRNELRKAVETAFGRTDLVAGVADPYVFLTPAARALPADKRAALDVIVRETLARHTDGIATVLDVDELLRSCPATLAAAKAVPARALPGEDVTTLVCRGVPSREATGRRLGDYYIVPKRGSFFDADYVPGHGTSHGTPYLYDRTVPLFVRASSRIAAGVVVSQPVDFSAYAALEASLLGLSGSRTPAEVLEAHVARPR